MTTNCTEVEDDLKSGPCSVGHDTVKQVDVIGRAVHDGMPDLVEEELEACVVAFQGRPVGRGHPVTVGSYPKEKK